MPRLCAKACWANDTPNTPPASTTWRMLLRIQGDYSAAKPLHEKALAIRKEVFGEHHPITPQA